MTTQAATSAPKLHGKPWTIRARASRAVRKHLDTQDSVTPHFTCVHLAVTAGGRSRQSLPLALTGLGDPIAGLRGADRRRFAQLILGRPLHADQ